MNHCTVGSAPLRGSMLPLPKCLNDLRPLAESTQPRGCGQWSRLPLSQLLGVGDHWNAVGISNCRPSPGDVAMLRQSSSDPPGQAEPQFFARLTNLRKANNL